ncbi:MAG TPA: glycosyltransferase family 4 protein [Tepidisphaeraceae bacterium]|jgi:UDP-glucose:(heptosyl)LPS alpha-1,3-glucosyltransferase
MQFLKLPVIYLVPAIHRGGGMERAAFEVLDRIRLHRPVVAIGRECTLSGVRHIPVSTLRRPAILSVAVFRRRARKAARRVRAQSGAGHSTGIGASGGPVAVTVAQYCQEAYRRRVGVVRGRGVLHTWYHRLTLSRFCAEERAVYRSPELQRVIAVSRGVGRELIECYGVDPAIVRYIPNGVDLATFRPLPGGSDAKATLRGELGLPTDGLLACFVGGDWRRKGLRPAIESLRDATGVRLVVVGAGDPAEFGAIAAVAGVANRVHFVGKRPDPHRYLQAADVYLFPSLYEAFSLSCIEAAACGLPLVVTKINGSEELVEEGVNGFFVEHDAASVATRLRELRDDASLRERMAARSAEVGQQYDWDTIAAAHEAVYAELDQIVDQKLPLSWRLASRLSTGSHDHPAQRGSANRRDTCAARGPHVG